MFQYVYIIDDDTLEVCVCVCELTVSARSGREGEKNEDSAIERIPDEHQ